MKNLAFLAPVLLILVACSSGAPATTTKPAGPTPTQGQATATGAATAATTPAPTTGGTAVDVCSLLTVTEVAAAAEMTLDTATPSSDELYSYCEYTGGNDRVRTFVTKSASTASTIFGTMKINEGEPVTGVGDEAFWSTDSFQPGLYFMKGGQLAYISGPQSGVDSAIVVLGTLMASRM